MEKGIEGNSGTDLIFLQELLCSSLFNTKTAVLIFNMAHWQSTDHGYMFPRYHGYKLRV
jgi:hypothetical protein